MTRKTSFYFSFLALPKRKRDVIVAVWDFCRAIDDSVDLETDPARARAALARWRAEVDRVFGGGEPETPQGRALAPLAGPHHLPRAEFDALIDGVAMDVTPRRYASFADLEPYCRRVASSVGLICAEIFEYRDRGVLDYARDLGIALQITNILRDVGVDYRRGRLYLPIEDLARFGCGEADVAAATSSASPPSERLRAALDHQAARARVFFSRAVRALPRHELRAVIPAEIMRAVYLEQLRRIEASGFAVFGPVIRVPRAAQARLAFVTWWNIRFGHPHLD